MDLATVTQALDALYQRAPHLPRRPDLAQAVLDAYREDLPESAWHLTGVVAALWPIGAAAGAERGHALTVGAIRGELAQALADPSPDARGRWVVMGMAKAADDLPAAPDPSHRPGVAGPLIGDPRRLDQALTIGLANSWVAGHRAASDAAIGRFAADVDDLVGHERIATTFLTPSLTAEMLLDEIALKGATSPIGVRWRCCWVAGEFGVMGCWFGNSWRGPCRLHRARKGVRPGTPRAGWSAP